VQFEKRVGYFLDYEYEDAQDGHLSLPAHLATLLNSVILFDCAVEFCLELRMQIALL
jgi:hypothetical protein